MALRQLLIISYDFPPSSVGIWRTLKFCRYLPECGWQPHVLTVRPVRSPRYDMAPVRELPPGTEIRRTESVDPNRVAFALAQLLRGNDEIQKVPPAGATNARYRGMADLLRAWVLQPDDRIGWYPFAVRKGARWLREKRFDVVYSTCFPFTAHLVGQRLAKKAGLPFLADFRDIWIGNYLLYRHATALHERLQKRMEQRVVHTAKRVVSATDPITQDFRDRYPGQPGEKFLTITNGYDEPDFDCLPQESPDPEHFTITYAGTLFGSTSPHHFFRAVQLLLEKTPRWREALRLRFVGSMIEQYRAELRQRGLDGITSVEPYMAHREALRLMVEADALLLLVARQPGSHIMLTQKVFEYAAARRPILGLVPESGAASDFLTQLGEGPVVAPDDVQGIAEALDQMLNEWEKEGRKELPPNPWLDQFSRRRLTESLAATLDDALS